MGTWLIFAESIIHVKHSELCPAYSDGRIKVVVTMVVSTWMRVKFHLSLIKARYSIDTMYPHLKDEETEGGRL